MALNVVSKISLSKKQIFVTSIKTSTVSCAYPASFRLSSLISIIHAQFIQPHFDYTCSVWYPNLNKKVKLDSKACRNN